MKKIIAIIMAVICICSCMSISTFAATSVMDGGQFEASYYIPSTYSVYIPEAVNLNEQTYMTADLINITPDEQVNVKADANVKMTNEYGNEINVILSNDGLIGVFTNSMTSDIPFFAQDEGGKAGFYTGIIEFTISLTPRT